MTALMLLCGNDPLLLHTRAMVLTSAAVAVEEVLGLSALTSFELPAKPFVVVLCHTFSEAEQTRAIEYCRSQAPEARIFALTKRPYESSVPGATGFSTFEGPRKLMETSRNLLDSVA